MDHPDIEPCNLINAEIGVLPNTQDNPPRKWCGSGEYMHTYDVHGNCYPCQFFMLFLLVKKKLKPLMKLTYLMSINLLMENAKNVLYLQFVQLVMVLIIWKREMYPLEVKVYVK